MKFFIKVTCRTHIDDLELAIPKVINLYDWEVTPYWKETATYTTNSVIAKGTDRSMVKAQRSAETFAKRYAKAKGNEIGVLAYDYRPGS